MSDEIKSIENELLDKKLEEEVVKLNEELKDFPISKINMKAITNRRTFCQILRDIYDKTNDKQIKNWCVEATIQGKKMTRRLLAYRKAQ
jgi:hypothetical protein